MISGKQMATNRKDMEKRANVEKMDRLFKISPVKMKAQDGTGQMITIEHRIGKEAGVFTMRDLMEKLGFEAEYAQFMKDMLRQIKNPDERKAVCDSYYSKQKSRARAVVLEYKKHLEYFYGNYSRPVLPAFAFVGVSDQDSALYMQGIVDAETYELLVGEPEDIYRWTETVYSKTKNFADLNKRAELQARALMKCPSINKEIKNRLHAITQGQLPEKLGFSG